MKSIKIILLLLIPVMALSCKKEKLGSDEREIEMQLSNGGLMTRSIGIEAERVIKTVDILVFNGKDVDVDDAKFLYSRYAWKKSNDTYRSVLKTGDGLDIYFAINARDILESAAIAVDTKWSEVRKLLIMEDPDQIDVQNKGLTMWGYKHNVDVAESSAAIHFGSIKLLRSVASTDIKVTADNFTLAKGYIAFGADKGYLPFSHTNTTTPDVNGDFKISNPEIPTGMTTVKEWSAVPSSSTPKELCNIFYMYENDAPANSHKHTKVILEGKWSDSNKTGNTFYPLSFRDADKNSLTYNEKIPVKRNTKYVFVISKVNGDGYDDLTGAKNGEDVNMEYKVIPWNDSLDGEIMIDGPNYFAIASKYAYLERKLGSTTELIFQTDFDLDKIKMKLNEDDAGEYPTLNTTRFKVEILEKTDKDNNTYNCFHITANKDYANDSDNPTTVIVTVGRLKFNLILTQLNESYVDWEDGGNTEAGFGK